MKRRNISFADKLTLMITSTLMIISLGCIFGEAEPVLPAYPAEIAAEISFTAIGSPSICKCMNEYDIALVAAGNSLVLIDMINGTNESIIDLGLEINDIADSDVDGYAYVLTGSLLHPVNLSGAFLEPPVKITSDCSYLSVSADGDTAWVSMDNDSIGIINLATLEVSVAPGIAISNCQGIASGDNGILFIAEGANGVITGYDTGTWTEIGHVSVPGEVYDLFPGPSGYICAIVDGSNELWFIKTETCMLYKMITFPAIPSAAASMPDGSFAYAACPGSGLIIVAQSGQIELRMMDFGLPSNIDISNDGERAVVCSPDNEAVYILVE